VSCISGSCDGTLGRGICHRPGQVAGDMEVPVLGARLVLATRPLGGFVSERYLQVAWDKQNHQSSLNRGHNWDWCARRPKRTTCAFNPSRSQDRKTTSLCSGWAAPAVTAAPKSFDGKFLGISNPFAQASSCRSGAYTQTWYIDGEGNRVAEDTPVQRGSDEAPRTLCPGSSPRAPAACGFLQPHRPGTGERVRRFAVDLTVSVLGLTSLSSWQYMLAKSSFMFVRRRHGAPLDRSARTRTYAQLRYSLKLDNSLDPELRNELETQPGSPGPQPLGVGLSSEIDTRPAACGTGQVGKIAGRPDAERGEGPFARTRRIEASRGMRMLFRLAQIGTSDCMLTGMI